MDVVKPLCALRPSHNHPRPFAGVASRLAVPRPLDDDAAPGLVAAFLVQDAVRAGVLVSEARPGLVVVRDADTDALGFFAGLHTSAVTAPTHPPEWADVEFLRDAGIVTNAAVVEYVEDRGRVRRLLRAPPQMTTVLDGQTLEISVVEGAEDLERACGLLSQGSMVLRGGQAAWAMAHALAPTGGYGFAFLVDADSASLRVPAGLVLARLHELEAAGSRS